MSIKKVVLPRKKFNDYKKYQDKKTYKEIKQLSQNLRGLSVAMVNSTPKGGGVAEILRSLVPLMNDIGLSVSWYTISCPQRFFEITKKFHNGLQGQRVSLSQEEKLYYLNCLKRLSREFKNFSPDVWLIHDPQPAALIDFVSQKNVPWIWRVHIDLTRSNRIIWNFLRFYLNQYNKIIFTSADYVKKDIKDKAVVFAPAIDPLSTKNRFLSKSYAWQIVRKLGLNPRQPVVSQVARFDVFKDPLGVIEAANLARKRFPDIQVVLAGFFLANDDPQALEVYKKTLQATKNMPNVYLLADPNLLKIRKLNMDEFINALQRISDVVVQKSLREGFSLAVTEAMWKSRPVIGGNVGGIRLQIKSGYNGYLVNSPEEAGQDIIKLLGNKLLRKKIGQRARQTVREKFLITRLLRDYLRLFAQLKL